MASEKMPVRAAIRLPYLRSARAFDFWRVVGIGALAVLLPALLVVTACSSGGSVTPPGGGSGAQTSGGSVNGGSGLASAGVQEGSGNPGASGTFVTASGSSTMTPPSQAACDTYCTAIVANCTGVNAQYHDKASCLKACSYLPAGTPADTSGNTIGCRTNVAAMAATQAGMVKSFCWQAGPLGYGTCGEECEAFCTIATSYCSAAGGYTGAPVWPDYATCKATCAQFGRVIDFGMDGGYSALGATGDTLECRAYHLVDNALQSPALQQAHCPHAAANSAACGPGPAASDGGTPPLPTGDAGARPMMVYDGGNIINASNWDETKYPFAKRRMLLRDEGDPHVHLEDLGDPTKNWSVPGGGAWSRSMQLVGNNQVLFGTDNGYNIVDLTDGHTIKTVTGYNSMAAYRMCNGDTMLTRPGTTLTFLDANDKVKSNISYPGYGYVRLARPTRNGTFLVPSDTKLFEGDANGKVLWVTTGAGWQHVWEALLMADGNTLLCTAFGSSCDVVDKTTHMVTKRYGGKNMPNAAMYNPNFFSEYQILWNGNIITANWQGHGPGHGNVGIQVIEFDPQGNVVWSWKQDGARYSSIQGVQVLDGMDPKYLHCQEKSTDSTWQPVMP